MIFPRAFIRKLSVSKNSNNPRRTFPSLRKSQKKEEKKEISSKTIKITYGNNRLLIIRNPDQKSINYLRKHYLLHPVHLDDICSALQRPKLDLEDHYIFMVLHIPHFDVKSKRIVVREIDCFWTENDVIMIPDEGITPLEELIKQFQKKYGSFFVQSS